MTENTAVRSAMTSVREVQVTLLHLKAALRTEPKGSVPDSYIEAIESAEARVQGLVDLLHSRAGNGDMGKDSPE